MHVDLRAAADLLGCVLTGQSLAGALPRLAQAGGWSPAQRGAAQALSFEALRGLGRARALLQAVHPKRIKPAELEQLLLVAIALLSAPGAECRGSKPACAGLDGTKADRLWRASPEGQENGESDRRFLESAADKLPPYPDHTLVSQAVQACALHAKTRHARGFVNALLRRVQAERVLAPKSAPEEAIHNHPSWWVARMRTAYPDAWQDVLALAAELPAMTLRVNARWGSRADYLARLRAAGLDAEAPDAPGLAHALVLQRAVPVQELPLFEAGAVSVQDSSAQLAAWLLQPGKGMRVLDACAAPGGKTAHMLELADCDVLALDQDAQRAARIGDTIARLRLPAARVAVADARRPDTWWDGKAFDRILLDAPCSASGIVRRHPDIRWLRQDADIAALAAQQTELLDALWPLLAPGGWLLYATCSVFPEEGVEQAAGFLRRHGDALALAAPGQILPGRSPERDGFFYALFAKRSTA